MSNNQLPADVQERIKADALKYADETYGESFNFMTEGQQKIWEEGKRDYITGATAEYAQNESVRLQLEAQDANVEILLNQKKELIDRSQVLVDALELIRDKLSGINDTITNDIVSIAEKYLQQWKEGKEVGK